MWETALGSPGGRHETVTLQAETKTPRRRTLSASFVRVSTPLVELPLARRQRLKNEDKARARALVRLDPVKHDQYLEAERARKRKCTNTVQVVSHVEPTSPAWKQQARERVAAEMAEAQERRDERARCAQEARVQRAAMTGSQRCGSCATCAELVMFGGTLWVKDGEPCETVLRGLVCRTVKVTVSESECDCDEIVRKIAWEDICVREY